jgi:CheY-like chemotaxis protein
MTDAQPLHHKPPRMLVADDDPAIVRMLAERCASMGFEVDTATNGVQALIKASRSHPDIMVIDVNMPEADGLTVCARLLEPSRRSLDVVVMTGSRETEAAERSGGFGAYFVRKGPAFWRQLEAALVELFPHLAHLIKAPQKHPTGAEIVRHRPRVLMIDDDVTIKQFLASRLDKCGVELIFASNIADGYRMACREAPSVIISEYFMPNGGISYLLSRLRTTSVTENIPLFVLSGRELDEVTRESLLREVCGKPGVALILRKSLDTDELFGALQKLCAFENNSVDV